MAKNTRKENKNRRGSAYESCGSFHEDNRRLIRDARRNKRIIW